VLRGDDQHFRQGPAVAFGADVYHVGVFHPVSDSADTEPPQLVFLHEHAAQVTLPDFLNRHV
jgi:hypothetical protein